MQLEKHGLSDWFQDRINAEKMQDFQLARIVSMNKNSYLISDGYSSVMAEVTGKLMFNAVTPLDYPAVGDWVYVQLFDDQSLAPHKNAAEKKNCR